MYTRRIVRNWQVIAEQVSKEHNQDRFAELLTELSEALDIEQSRKLKLHIVPKVPNRITVKEAPSQ